MPSKADTPLTTTYRPELDVSRELNEVDVAYYQSLIGILRWMVELGQVDVCWEVCHHTLHYPEKVIWSKFLHIFAYLKKYHNTELVYDPSDPVVDENDFDRRDWASSEFGHVEGKEEFPANMPERRGHGFIMRAKSGCRSCMRYSFKAIKNRIAYIFELCPGLLVEQEADFS